MNYAEICVGLCNLKILYRYRDIKSIHRLIFWISLNLRDIIMFFPGSKGDITINFLNLPDCSTRDIPKKYCNIIFRPYLPWVCLFKL